MTGRRGYGAGLLLLQALLLTSCGPQPTAVTNTTAAATPDAPAPAIITPVAGPERSVLAFGDSLYAGYGLARGQSLPDAIQARLRAQGLNALIVNAGVSGDTTAAGRQRLSFALDNLKRKPDLVLLGLGGNDVLRQITPVETRANLAAMLGELRDRKIPVILTGMRAPPNLGPDYVAAFDRIFPDLAKDYGATLYPFILDGVIGNRSLMQADSIHPNITGVARIADRLAPVVAERLKEGEL
jgi:acyl-CoA thioesterase-1